MRGLIIFYIFLIATHSTRAQNEYNFYGKGARAAGMGYAFNAVSDDASAMSWNPAGMTQIKKPELALAGSMKLTDYIHSFDDQNHKPVFMVDYAGFVYPIKLKKRNLVLGLNFQTLINYKSKYSNSSFNGNAISGYKNTLTVNSVSLCGAYPITQYLSLGVSLNTWFSLGNKSHEYSYYNWKEIDSTEYEYDEIYRNRNGTYGYSGVDMSTGFITDFSTFNFPLRFAFNFRSESIIRNNYKETYQKDFLYEMVDDTTYLYMKDGLKKYYYHRIFALGLSYRINDYFTIACDYDFRPFKNSAYSWEYRDYSDNGTLLVDTMIYAAHYISESNENLHQFRIGIEYILHPDLALIPLRIGWKNNPTTLTDYGKNGELNNQVYASSINVGTGLIMKRFSVDFAYERYAWERYEKWMNDKWEINYDYEKKINHLFFLSLILHL